MERKLTGKDQSVTQTGVDHVHESLLQNVLAAAGP